MSTNFMGLGFSFGAKDTGLDSALSGINSQFKQLNDSVTSFQASAAQGLSPAENIVTDLQSQLGDLQKEASGGTNLADAIDIGEAGDKAKKEVGGLTDAVGGMAAETALGGTKFGRMANSVLGGAGKITGALGWVGLALGPVIAGFGQAAESAGGMVDAVTGLPRRAGDAIHRIATEGINLTHSLEAEAVGLATSARAVGANMGYVGQELNRFTGRATGMAMGLNVGADEAARALRAVDEAGSELAAMSLDNAQDVARLQAAFGINADLLRNAGLGMRNELGMDDAAIGQITSSIFEMGQRTGDVSGAVNEMNEMMVLLRRRRALGDTPEQLQQFASDASAAATGMFQFTQDSELVRGTSHALAEQLTENRESFRNMFAGAESEFPQLMTELSIVSGGVDEAFDSMTQGPGQFLESMGSIVSRVRSSGGNVGETLEFMRGRLQQVFGADQTATMINFWSNMDESTSEAMQATRGASVDLGELAQQAHRTGRTMDEVFERMRGAFQVSIRRFARSDSRDFMRNTRDSLRDLRVAADEAHRSQGPLSDVMGLISRSGQLGALALMPAELRGSAVAADELRGQIMPLINAFSSWGGVLETVLGYVSIFATDVISSWGGIMRASRTANGETMDSMEALGQAIDQQSQRYAGIFEDWIDGIENWVVRATTAFSELDFGALFDTTSEGEEDQGVMGAVRRIVNRIGDIDWAGIWTNLQAGFNNLFEAMRPWLEEKMEQIRTIIYDRINAWWNGIDWDEVFSTVRGMASALWTAFQPALSALGDLIADWFSEHWIEILGWTSAALGAALLALLLAMVVAIVAAVVLLAAGIVGIVAALTYMTLDYFHSLGPALSEIWQFIVNEAGDYFEQMGEDIAEIGQYIANEWNDMWRDVGRFFRNLWNGIANWFGNLWDGITENFNQAIEDWQTIFSTVGEFFTGVGTSIRDTIGGAISWIRTQWDAFVSGLEGVWETLSAGWDELLSGAEEFWDNLIAIPARIETAWEGITGFFRRIFSGIREAMGNDLQQVGALFETLADVGTRALNLLLGTAEDNHSHSIHTLIEEDLAQAEEYLIGMAGRVSEVMTAILHDAVIEAIVTGFQTGFDTVIENMGEFSIGMVDAFTVMAEGISEIMTSLFTSILSQSELTMLGTETAVESIIARLRTITAAQARLAEERSTAVSTLARPADEAAMRRRMAQLQGNDVLRAVHHPDWYGGVAGNGGYQRLFVVKMNELREAIAALSVNPASGTLEQRRQLVREASSGVRRTGVGGHNGSPGGPGR